MYQTVASLYFLIPFFYHPGFTTRINTKSGGEIRKFIKTWSMPHDEGCSNKVRVIRQMLLKASQAGQRVFSVGTYSSKPYELTSCDWLYV